MFNLQPVIITPEQALQIGHMVEGLTVLLKNGHTLVSRSYGWAVVKVGEGPIPVSHEQATSILMGHVAKPLEQVRGGVGGALLSHNGAS